MSNLSLVWAVRCVALVALIACDKDAPVSGGKLRTQLQIHADVATAGEQVEVSASYLRTGATEVSLARVRVPVAGPGRLDVPVELDLTACLADPSRVGGTNAGCPVVASIVLRDAGGITMDSTRIGPIEVREGATASPPAPVTLQAASTLVIESGDQQLGWNGRPLHVPVVARLTDRAGNPIRGRTVTVVPMTGGGQVLSSSLLVTDTAGRATIRYQLGTATGPQEFAVRAAAGAATIEVRSRLTSIVPRAERVTGGFQFSCDIQSGVTRCWGGNSSGGLGNRAVPADTALPVPVATSQPLVSLSASRADNLGGVATCGLTATGSVYCWGLSPTGALGQQVRDTCQPPSGRATQCNRDPVSVPFAQSMAVIDLGGLPAAIVATDERLCGVTVAGDAVCVGENLSGALGDGTNQTKRAPVVVSASDKWIDISTADAHTCGLTAYGEAWCWGFNSRGVLGTGDTVSTLVPRRVATQERFQAISTAAYQTCALTVAGELRCWGQYPVATPAQGAFGNSLVPVPPPGTLTSLRTLSMGLVAGCATDVSGTGYCWGSAANLPLGDGVVRTGYVVARVRAVAPWSEISPGIFQICGLTTTTSTYCWGQGGSGELGIGLRNYVARVPTLVTSVPPVAGVPTLLVQESALGAYAVSGGSCFGPALSVRVVDRNGYPVAGEPVQFLARTPGAAVAAASATTNAVGLAGTACTVSSTPGLNRFVARVARVPNDSIEFTTTGAIPGPAARIFCRLCASGVGGLVGRLNPIGAFAQAVQVLDTLGLPVAGAQVTFSKLSTSRTTFIPALPATIVTDAFGEARLTSFQADTIARTDSIQAVVAALPNQPQLLLIITQADTPSSLRFGPLPQSWRAGQPGSPPVTVTLHDQYGNVTGTGGQRQVTLTLVGPGGGSLGGTTTVTAINGRAAFTDLTISAPGTYQLIASSQLLPNITSLAITVLP